MHREGMDRRLALEPGREPHEIVVEEAQDLGEERELRIGCGTPGRDIGPRAVVPGAEQQMPLLVGQGQEARDRAVGIAGAVHPAGDRVDRDIGAGAGGVAVGAEGARAELGIVGERVVLEAELGDEVGHMEIAEMLVHRFAAEGAVVILVDRLRAHEIRVLEIGEFRQHLAAVVVERDHQLVIGLGELGQQQPAGEIMVAPGVPDGEERGDRLDRGMAGAGEEIAGGADIGDAGRADRAVRPGLRHDPVGDLAEILALGRRAEAVARAEAGAGAAHVDDDHGIAARHEHVAILAGIGARLRACRRAVPQLEAAVIGGEDQDGRQTRRRGLPIAPLRQVDIDREAAAVAHREIARLRRCGLREGIPARFSRYSLGGTIQALPARS